MEQTIERQYLGRGRMLVKMRWGIWLVIPTFNVDVAIGAMRDGIIEPWTTRLVQELLRPGMHYLNAGANFGYYPVLAASIVGDNGTSIGVEPNPHIFPFFMESCFWSGQVNRITAYNTALSDKQGEVYNFSFDPQYLGGGFAHVVNGKKTAGAKFTFEKALWSAQSIGSLMNDDQSWDKTAKNNVHFDTTSTTIDAICKDRPPMDLIHLDIEGSEWFALKGAAATIKRSPNLRLITEWTSDYLKTGNKKLATAFNAFWSSATAQGFRPRMLIPQVEANGAIRVSDVLTHDYMTTDAPHGDYIWLKPDQDPWGK